MILYMFYLQSNNDYVNFQMAAVLMIQVYLK